MTDHILSSPEKVLFMSITELAEACGVGDTSASRFCKTTNCRGYRKLKTLLSPSLHEGKQGFEQMESDISLEDSFSQVAERVLSSNIKAFKEIHPLLKEDVFRRIIECSCKTGHICFCGVDTNMAIVMEVVDKFLRTEPKVYCASGSHMQVMMVSTMSSGEIAVAFPYSGATKNTIHVTQLIRQAEVVIIYVTRFIESPLTVYANPTLLCRASKSPLQTGSSSAEIGQLFPIDTLYTEYYRIYYDRCSANDEKTSVPVMEKLHRNKEKRVLK